MKRTIFLSLLCLLSFSSLFAQDESAYFLISSSNETMADGMARTKAALTESGFKIIGEYHPAQSQDLGVVCYTHPDLEKIALGFKDRGALAATLKIGFKKDGETLQISMINPIYLFYAYFVDGVDQQEKALQAISDQVVTAMQNVGTMNKPFGGTLDKNKLQKYHYKVMMPYFTDAEELKTFDSFDEGVKTIQQNLEAGLGETEQVYELVYTDNQVAVWGVGLKNTEDGEAHFLPIIGDDHVAAMPYEIILQGNTASILPGKYRIALHWPELTMGTFMKIMSTPGDIKSAMEKLTE
ncbi:hypothetical protein SLH46_19565 [Draconibacterium sp. IB214405]|uniref:hypothetical protein n=1 Tax=Draconibacterium sp. IB214405 TaxID=3097352 RepID=UPI002A13B5B2|nr:hypothetical protein [Draconibacterium sp. IB214405]MDX8341406.1 hypothetical protein [Draconibacterium sp. IB214405]